ncbi:MAG: hypothetical protein EOP00_31085 [Pedobacter sp.]|nr:MAG: hypothetical protein EOP00_31085 [Pedobacter sp.]
MRTDSNVNPSIIEVEKLPGSLEKFSFTLNKGKLKAQEIEALLEFKFLCQPYNGLRIINTMMLSYLVSNEVEEIEPKDVDALNEVLRLFTNLWAAEHGRFEPVDLNFF